MYIYIFDIFIFHFSEILHEAEELWNRQGSDTSSEAGSSSTGGSDISDTISQRSHRSALAQAMAKQQALAVHGGKFLNNKPIKKSSTVCAPSLPDLD